MTFALPPDRGHLRTEQRHEASVDLDALSTAQCVKLMIDDHARVCEACAQATPLLASFIDDLVQRMRGGGRLVYLGAGTSGRLGVLDASECPPTFQSDPSQIIGIIAGGDGALRTSSEGAEDDPEGAKDELTRIGIGERDTLLGIAAGGTTPYVLGAITLAKASGAMTGLLTCAALEGPLHGCDHLIFLDTGPELLTGSTRLKAGSATKLALNIISTTLFIKLGKVYSNLMVDVRATNNKLRDRAIRILMELCPKLDRNEAATMLAETGGELKTAVLAQRLDIDASSARLLLSQHGGSLRAALDEA